MSKNAFDDQAPNEILQEKQNEFEKYDKALLMLDLDSLAGITLSNSESGMVHPYPSSVAGHKMFSFVINLMAMAKVNIQAQKWVVVFDLKSAIEKILYKVSEVADDNPKFG